jgi:uncharacterized phage protein (TIGR01671 family)
MTDNFIKKSSLFRGKRVDNGEWVIGYYCVIEGISYRIYTGYAKTVHGEFCPDWYEVIPETVSQYTGWTDKYRIKIFEGDIINITPNQTNRLMEVRWNDETVSWELTDIGTPTWEVNHLINTISLGELELEACYGEPISFIVGNIYDNPELMEDLNDRRTYKIC